MTFALAGCLIAPGLGAQTVRAGAQAVAVATRADPIPGGGSLTELRVVQPLVMIRATLLGGRLALRGTADLEGWTMPRGETRSGSVG